MSELAELDRRIREFAKVKKAYIPALESAAADVIRMGIPEPICRARLHQACTENGAPQDRVLIDETITKAFAKHGNDHAHHMNGAAFGTLRSQRASDISMRAIKWLWKDRFALGKLSLIGGLPDKGKGLFTAFFMGCITNNQPLPCNEGHMVQGSVILLTAEDDYSDTVVPRLHAAGANLDKVHIITATREATGKDRIFSLLRDLEALRKMVDEIGDVVCVIIDPLDSYVEVGKVNNSNNSDVRGFLKPLCDLAAEKMFLVLGIKHFNKKQDVTNAVLRIADSLAYAAAARHVYAVVDDPEVEDRRLFVKAKNNSAGPAKKTLSFLTGVRMVGNDPETTEDILAPYLEWGPSYVEISASDAMQAEAGGNRGRAERQEAKDFLQDRLAAGPLKQSELFEEAEGAGISKSTLNRAKKDLKVVSRKGKGLDNAWTWELPE